MRIRAGIVGLGLAGALSTALGQTSPYSSMAMPGDHNSWDTTPSMALVADNTWVATQTLSSASGGFKFAANNGWANNWGGNAAIARVPASATAPDPGGDNLTYAGLSNGPYRITFNDSTLAFRMEWAGVSPLPPPAVTSLAVVGEFNGWTPNPNSVLTNHVENTNVWSGSIALENATAFQFYLNDSWDNQYGAPSAITLSPPVTNGNASGKSDITLSGFQPGTFFFTLNTTNAAFTISQTATQTFSSMRVEGSFLATNNPVANMMRVSGTTLWESDHHITNTTAVTMRFSANQGAYTWGVTNGTPSFSLPATGTLLGGRTNFASVGVNAPGRYRATFDHLTGDFSFRRLYVDTSQGTNINLLKNPGFEFTTDPAGGDAVDWGGWQAWPKRAVDGFTPHSGNGPEPSTANSSRNGRTTALLRRMSSSLPARRTGPPPGSRPRRTGPPAPCRSRLNGGRHQRPARLRGHPDRPRPDQLLGPPFRGGRRPGRRRQGPCGLPGCSGAGTIGTMHIDDAEFRAVAGRIQDFETWGSLTSFGAFAPDWSITSGKVVYNIPPGRPAAGVFISQYVEGTGNNKAVEIYNGTLDTIDLGAGTMSSSSSTTAPPASPPTSTSPAPLPPARPSSWAARPPRRPTPPTSPSAACPIS
jgi:hypothetical protein